MAEVLGSTGATVQRLRWGNPPSYLPVVLRAQGDRLVRDGLRERVQRIVQQTFCEEGNVSQKHRIWLWDVPGLLRDFLIDSERLE